MGLTIRDDISTRGRPKALKKAQNLRCNVTAARTRLSEYGSKRTSLDERPMLARSGKEGAARNLLPEVIPSLVPGHLISH